MTDEKQAVKILAEQMVKAMKTVSSNSSLKVTGGTTPGTITASKIVGLPAAISSIFSSIETSAAQGDAIAQQLLDALNHIALGEFETITADTAMIEKVYATFADFITLVADNAVIGDLDVAEIRASLAEIGLLDIGSATITTAQIERASTGTLFVRDEIGGKVYIDDLAVSDANIVSLAAGKILLNDTNGNLVELYVNNQGNISTRSVSYDGTDIINSNSLNGNRIIQNSITTDRLNANEIFASQGTVMDLIADNIEATRLFANQGFIPTLETTIINSSSIGSGLDLTSNSSITLLQNSIELLAGDTSRTFITPYEPIPTHKTDTWFNPTSEEHYVSTGILLPKIEFGHDNDGNLCNIHSEAYQFEIDSSGNLKILVVDEDVEDIIVENDLDFSITNNYLHINNMWKKIENVAFSDLKVSVDGIISEVYDSQTGQSIIEQNSDSISAIVSGSTAVPYVETSGVKIKNNKIEVSTTGEVDINAATFSISFNTDGSLTNKSRVDISNNVGLKISDSNGNYFQANSTKIGLYDIQDNAKLYMNSSGDAVFAGTMSAACITSGTMSAERIQGGTLTLGGANNGNGTLVVNNASGNKIVELNNSGIAIYNGSTKQFYVDNSGNVIFAGSLNAATGTFEGTMSAACITSGTMSAGRIYGGTLTLGGANNSNGTLVVNNASGNKIVELNRSGIAIYNGNTKQLYIDNDGNAVFAGSLSAATGTFAGTMSAACITSGTMSAERIQGGTLTLGGANNGNGTLVVNNASGSSIVTANNNGLSIDRGNITSYSNDGKDRVILSSGNLLLQRYDQNSQGAYAWNDKLRIKNNYSNSGDINSEVCSYIDSSGKLYISSNGDMSIKNISIGDPYGGKITLNKTGNIIFQTREGFTGATFSIFGDHATLEGPTNWYNLTVYGTITATEGFSGNATNITGVAGIDHGGTGATEIHSALANLRKTATAAINGGYVKITNNTGSNRDGRFACIIHISGDQSVLNATWLYEGYGSTGNAGGTNRHFITKLSDQTSSNLTVELVSGSSAVKIINNNTSISCTVSVFLLEGDVVLSTT